MATTCEFFLLIAKSQSSILFSEFNCKAFSPWPEAHFPGICTNFLERQPRNVVQEGRGPPFEILEFTHINCAALIPNKVLTTILICQITVWLGRRLTKIRHLWGSMLYTKRKPWDKLYRVSFTSSTVTDFLYDFVARENKYVCKLKYVITYCGRNQRAYATISFVFDHQPS